MQQWIDALYIAACNPVSTYINMNLNCINVMMDSQTIVTVTLPEPYFWN